jgi:hypothetical protein
MRLGIVAALCTLALGASPALGRAIELPAKAQALRDQGVPASEVATAVRAAHDHGLNAGDTADLLEAARGAKLDDLGSFVREKLDEGLRGRELADAIHEEQARRGQGRPDDPGDGRGKAPDGEKGGKGPDAEHPDHPGGNPHDDGEKTGKGKSGKGGR